MGAGKSYWGRRLAQYGGLPFYDLDSSLAAVSGLSVAQYFDRYGELAFRRLERQVLQESVALPPGIMATGGGTPCFFDNMAWMNAQGETVYLEVPTEVLAGRLRSEIAQRPLLAGVAIESLSAKVEALLKDREPWYAQARHLVPYTHDSSKFWEQLTAFFEMVKQRGNIH